MTKEVKLDGPSSLPPRVTPKTVTKKYTIQGPGAAEAAVKLKAQLAAARPGKPGGPGKSLVDPAAVKASQAQQAQQAQTTRNASGVVNAKEVSAQQTAKGSLGTQVQGKITLPSGQYAKPDPKLLQSVALKLGTAPGRLAAALNDPAKTLEWLMGTNTGRHFTDAELAMLLLDVDHTERTIDELLSSVSSTLDQQLAQLKVEQTKIDNSFDKMGHMVSCFDNLEAGATAWFKGNEGLRNSINDLREHIAEQKAVSAQKAVDNNLAVRTASPEAQAAIGAAPAPNADPKLTPVPDPKTLAAAEENAQKALTAALGTKPPDGRDIAFKRATLTSARAARFAGLAAGPVTADSLKQMRAVIAAEQKNDDEDPDADATERSAARVKIATQLGRMTDLAFNAKDVPDNKKIAAEGDKDYSAQLEAIAKDNGQLAAAEVEDKIQKYRAANYPPPADGSKAPPGPKPAPHTVKYSIVKLRSDLQEARNGLTKLEKIRDEAVAGYEKTALTTSLFRLRSQDPPVPDVGAFTAAQAHAVAAGARISSATQRQLETYEAQLVDEEMKAPQTPESIAKITALNGQIDALNMLREQEKSFAHRMDKTLYGSDDYKNGVHEHSPGDIDRLTTLLSQGNITGTEFAAAMNGSIPPLEKFRAAIRTGKDVSAAMGGVDDTIGQVHNALANAALHFDLNGRKDLKPGDADQITAAHAATLATLNHTQVDFDAAEHDYNTKNVELANLKAGTPTEAALKAAQAKADRAAAHLQAARENVRAAHTANEFLTRKGAAAPHANEAQDYLRVLGKPSTTPVAAPGEKDTPQPGDTVFGLRAKVAALDDVMSEPPTAKQTALRASYAAALRQRNDALQVMTDISARRSEDAARPSPVPVPTPWLGADAKLETFDHMQLRTHAADAAAGGGFRAERESDLPGFYDRQLQTFFDNTPAGKTGTADEKKAARGALEARAMSPDPTPPAKDTPETMAFINAFRATTLHKAVDGQLSAARLGHDSGWRPENIAHYKAKKEALDKATAAWLHPPPAKSGDAMPPARTVAPTLADLSSTDPVVAAAAKVVYEARDAVEKSKLNGDATAKERRNEDREPVVKAAIDARTKARESYADATRKLAPTAPPLSAAERPALLAQQAKASADIDMQNKIINGADVYSESAVDHFTEPQMGGWAKLATSWGKATEGIARIANQTQFYQHAEYNRRRITGDANELWQKMSNVTNASRSQLLHAIDRDAGSREAVFQVLQQLVEDAAKGRG